MYHDQGEGLSEAQLQEHWKNLKPAQEFNGAKLAEPSPEPEQVQPVEPEVSRSLETADIPVAEGMCTKGCCRPIAPDDSGKGKYCCKRCRDSRGKRHTASCETRQQLLELDERDPNAKKLAELERVQQQREADEERQGQEIDMQLRSTYSAGDTFKVEGLCVDVGTAKLLDDATLTISSKAQRYGLMGPNGCGKTTLMRLIDLNRLPTPDDWDVHLVRQLEPAPAGRSPVQEVLASHPRRQALLRRLRRVQTERAKLDAIYEAGEAVSDEQERRYAELLEEEQDVDDQLMEFAKAPGEITQILTGLGFHPGEGIGPDGAPSLKPVDELVTDPSRQLRLGEAVDVRDGTDDEEQEWHRGTVTQLEPLLVRPDGWAGSYAWASVRQARTLSGGWRKKLELGKALWLQPKLLLLDEPTNHLDFHALLYLEEKLSEYPHTVVLVSHDFEFVTSVCSKLLHVRDKKIELHNPFEVDEPMDKDKKTKGQTEKCDCCPGTEDKQAVVVRLPRRRRSSTTGSIVSRRQFQVLARWQDGFAGRQFQRIGTEPHCTHWPKRFW